jgi:tetratricopeptide (TPR) repeat protein
VIWGLINHYVGQSEFAKAKPLMQKGIEHRLKVYGPNSMATVEVKENLSYVHLQLEEYEEAERLLRECMDVAEHGPIQGVIQAHYANSCRNKLGACFNLQERYPEAAEIVKQSIEYQHWSPASRWKQADAKGILGEALTGMGQYEKAEQVLLEAQRGLEEQTSQMVPVVQERNLKKMAARFASLYEKLGRKADHAKWQRVLDGYDD